MILKSRFADVTIPENMSWPEYVYRNFDSYGDRTAIIDGVSGHCYTFKQLRSLTRKFASSLVKKGFIKGEVFAIYLPNIVEYAIIFYGVGFAGGTSTTVNPLYTAEELEKQLSETQATYLATSRQFLDKALTASKAQGKIKKIIVIDPEEEVSNCDYESFTQLVDDDEASFPEQSMIYKDDLFNIPFSSGTTGFPKGVMITHGNMLADICIMLGSGTLVLTEETVLMALLPFYHTYAQLIMLGAGLAQGCKVVVLQRFEPETFLQVMQDYKVTYAPVVPPIVLFLAKDPLVDKFDLSSVEEVLCAAAPMGDGLEDALSRRLPKVKEINQGYGMTEMLATHMQPRGGTKPGSAGVLLANLECKVVSQPWRLDSIQLFREWLSDKMCTRQSRKILDVSTGVILGPHQDGEICVRGPTVMKGYLNNPEATARLIDSEGWVHTGDIGNYDDEGHFFIVDRLKELIKYNAYQVAPAELEALLISHPNIDDAAVIGIPDEKAGELPKAFVVPKGDIKPEQILAFVAAKVAPQKKLRGGVEIIEKIPKNASGKILRRDLRKRENERLNNKYAS